MKIKLDHITNSSSTAFFFIFKGDKKEDLFNLIQKYHKDFEKTEDFGYKNKHDYRSVDSKFVIDSIENTLSVREDFLYDKCEIKSIENLIEEQEKNIKDYEKLINKRPSINAYYNKYIDEDKKRLDDMIKYKMDGFTHFLEIEFGDNHGHVAGGNASVMEHAVKEIKKKDFIVLKESKH